MHPLSLTKGSGTSTPGPQLWIDRPLDGCLDASTQRTRFQEARTSLRAPGLSPEPGAKSVLNCFHQALWLMCDSKLSEGRAERLSFHHHPSPQLLPGRHPQPHHAGCRCRLAEAEQRPLWMNPCTLRLSAPVSLLFFQHVLLCKDDQSGSPSLTGCTFQ